MGQMCGGLLAPAGMILVNTSPSVGRLMGTEIAFETSGAGGGDKLAIMNGLMGSRRADTHCSRLPWISFLTHAPVWSS